MKIFSHLKNCYVRTIVVSHTCLYGVLGPLLFIMVGHRLLVPVFHRIRTGPNAENH